MSSRSASSRSGSIGTPATAALARAGMAFTSHTYDHDATSTSYGLEASEKLGVEPARVFKTLVAAVDGALVVGVVPVSGSLDLKALAAAAGGKRATLADVAVVERSSGYVVGGVSPIAQRKPLPTVIDASVLDHATVLVSGGRRGLDLELAPADLISLTSATTAPIARPA